MKQEDNISQLFRDNEHKLDEMPSTLAWDKLEQRLDERDSHQKSFTFKRMAVAAAVFIAFSMLALWTYINPLNNAMSDNTAMFVEKRLPSEIVASDAPSPARPILMSHRERSKYLTELDNVRINTKPGLAKKWKKGNNLSNKSAKQVRPVPTPSIVTTPQPIASADLDKAKETQGSLPITSTTPSITTSTYSNEVKETQISPSTTSVTKSVVSTGVTDTKVAPTIKAFETLPSKDKKLNEEQVGYIQTAGAEIVKEESVKEEILEQANEEDDEIRTAPAAIVMDEIQTTPSVSVKTPKNRRNKRKSRVTGKSSKDMPVQTESVLRSSGRSGIGSTPTIDIESESAEQGIDKFDWLLGKWADEADSSFEEWYRTDADTIEGKGYFVVDVDTTFTHSMRLVELNKQVYFMVNGQLVEGNFQLESYDNRRAIFKNGTNNNAQITLKQDATNTFSMTVEDQSTQKEAKESKRKRRTLKRVKKNNEK